LPFIEAEGFGIYKFIYSTEAPMAKPISVFAAARTAVLGD